MGCDLAEKGYGLATAGYSLADGGCDPGNPGCHLAAAGQKIADVGSGLAEVGKRLADLGYYLAGVGYLFAAVGSDPGFLCPVTIRSHRDAEIRKDSSRLSIRWAAILAQDDGGCFPHDSHGPASHRETHRPPR